MGQLTWSTNPVKNSGLTYWPIVLAHGGGTKLECRTGIEFVIWLAMLASLPLKNGRSLAAKNHKN